MRVLEFKHRNKYYLVSLEPDTMGQVIRAGNKWFKWPHPEWRIIGFSHHHWCTNVSRTMEQVAEDAQLAMGCYVWDEDHGTTRTWADMYCGKTARVSYIRVIDDWKPLVL